MAQNQLFSGGKSLQANEVPSRRSSLYKLGDEDQILRIDPLYEDWYEYSESELPQTPPDFAERLAIHITVLLERHTVNEATDKIAALLARHIETPKMYIIFLKMLRLFLHNSESLTYLSVIWSAMLDNRKLVHKKKVATHQRNFLAGFITTLRITISVTITKIKKAVKQPSPLWLWRLGIT